MSIIAGASLQGASITVVPWAFGNVEVAGQGHHQNVGSFVKKILLTKFPINRPLQSFGPAHIRATKEHHADISTDIFTES